ncbi:MAG: hypothetical protein AYP45_17555 [Candidatus Brocadia carolinensis]|uniref:Uncharacterized protein n=1 Tax=Candidatus Brocadia carolinensis TaxID=1004156 RepID=A0A1V4AP81_9BACT|nr:MAG: hypothetical protein AYP45_17555 [Candidatus Brocadia caroliniensis]
MTSWNSINSCKGFTWVYEMQHIVGIVQGEQSPVIQKDIRIKSTCDCNLFPPREALMKSKDYGFASEFDWGLYH